MAASGTHRGWYRDIPNATLDAVYDGTDVMQLTATGVTIPGTLAVTGAQTFGGALTIADDIGLGIGGGNVSLIEWVTDDANANKLVIQLPAGGAVDVPVIAIGQGAGMLGDMALYNGVTEPTIAMFGVGAVTTGPTLDFRKARGTIAAPTVVTTGDDIGRLNFYGCVAAGEYVLGASIEADMAGTIATTRGPSTLTFKTATDAAPSVLTTAMTISAAQLVTLAAGLTVTAGATSFGGNVTATDDVLVSVGTGSTARISWDTTDANANEMLIQLPAGGGTDVPVIAIGQAIESVDLGLFNGVVDPTISLLSAGAWATGSSIDFRHARGTLTSPTVVTSGDDLGSLDFYACVAAGEYVRAARILVECTGTPGTTRGPGVITIQTATDAAPSVLTTAITISAAQLVTLASGTTTGNHTFSNTVTGSNGVGTSGEQLQSAGAGTQVLWGSAGSGRENKNLEAEVSSKAEDALGRMLGAKVYEFHYKPDAKRSTRDNDTLYRGIVADEYPEVMHHNGAIFNPINAFGETVLATKALGRKLEAALARIAQLEGKGLQPA